MNNKKENVKKKKKQTVNLTNCSTDNGADKSFKIFLSFLCKENLNFLFLRDSFTIKESFQRSAVCFLLMFKYSSRTVY